MPSTFTKFTKVTKLRRHIPITDDFRLIWAILGEMAKNDRLARIDWAAVGMKIGVNTIYGAKSRWTRLEKAMKEQGHELPVPREYAGMNGTRRGEKGAATKGKGKKKAPAHVFEVESSIEDESTQDEDQLRPPKKKAKTSPTAATEYVVIDDDEDQMDEGDEDRYSDNEDQMDGSEEDKSGGEESEDELETGTENSKVGKKKDLQDPSLTASPQHSFFASDTRSDA